MVTGGAQLSAERARAYGPRSLPGLVRSGVVNRRSNAYERFAVELGNLRAIEQRSQG